MIQTPPRPEPHPEPLAAWPDSPATATDPTTPGVEAPGAWPPGDEDRWTPRAGRRNLREKLVAGLIGLKHAIRGDSSFFAHAYRAVLVALIASMIGIDPRGWCLLGLGLGLVLVAELAHSAVDTLARAIGDPEEPRLRVAREIAAAGVLVAVIISATVSVTVLTMKFGELLNWWS